MAAPNPSEQVRAANLPAQKPEPISDPIDTDFDPSQDLPDDALPTKQAAPVHEAPKQSHPRGLTRRALALHATQAQIDATSTDDLDDWVEAESAKLAHEREQNARARAVNEFMDAQRRPTPQPEPVDTDAAELEELEKDFDPRLAGFLKKVVAKNKELQKTVDSTVQQSKTRRQQELHEAYDAFFESAGPLAKELYGEGSGADQSAQSEEMQRRIAMIVSANIDADNDMPATVHRKLTKAHKLVYGKLEAKAPTTPEVEPEPEAVAGYGAPAAPLKARAPTQPNGKPRLTQDQFDQAALARPVSRGKKPAKSRDGAIRAVAQQIVENGLQDKDFDFEEDGLPE